MHDDRASAHASDNETDKDLVSAIFRKEYSHPDTPKQTREKRIKHRKLFPRMCARLGVIRASKGKENGQTKAGGYNDQPEPQADRPSFLYQSQCDRSYSRNRNIYTERD